MRVLPAAIVVAALVDPGLSTQAFAARLHFPSLSKVSESACERKADGVYCGKGLKRKYLFKCVSGAVAVSHICDFRCDPKSLACLRKPLRGGAASASTAEDPAKAIYAPAVRRR